MKYGEPKPLIAKATSPSESQTPTSDARRSLWSLATSKTSLAILDQAVVSGTRFLTTIFIGRLCGSEELGIYSLTFAFYLIFACTQEALVTTPYMVFGNRLHGLPRRTLAGSVLLHSVILSLAAALAVSGGALMLWLGFGHPELLPATFTLAVVLPFMLLWEFARRYAIAHLDMGRALILDVATATLHIAGIGWLAWRADLSSVSGYLALGVGCACTASAWFVLTRHEFRFQKSHVVSDGWKNWGFGKWVLASQIMGTLHGYTPMWVLVLTIGTSATGVFAACQNLVLLSNPLILAITNLVGATTARAFAEGGYAAVRQIVRSASLYSSAAMGVLWALLLVAGGPAVVLLYGEEFSGNGYVVSTIALAAPLWAVSCVIGVGLRAVGRPDADFRARLVGLLTTVVSSVALVVPWGVPGVAYALVAGSAASTLWQAWVFYRVIPTEDHPPAVE